MGPYSLHAAANNMREREIYRTSRAASDKTDSSRDDDTPVTKAREIRVQLYDTYFFLLFCLALASARGARYPTL